MDPLHLTRRALFGKTASAAGIGALSSLLQAEVQTKRYGGLPAMPTTHAPQKIRERGVLGMHRVSGLPGDERDMKKENWTLLNLLTSLTSLATRSTSS